MDRLSRREFIYLSASLSLVFPFQAFALNIEKNYSVTRYPNTILVLKKAFKSEMLAHKHYVAFTQKALVENYLNIAYLFHALSLSEKIHADNYKRIIGVFGSQAESISVTIDVRDTKSNLSRSAEREMEKINITYPGFLITLETESCEEAIINCMYSWKSHRQHEEKVEEMLRYSGFFFGMMAKKIEKKNLDFFGCKICGSTIDEKPKSPCNICNRSLSHYEKVDRPA